MTNDVIVGALKRPLCFFKRISYTGMIKKRKKKTKIYIYIYIYKTNETGDSNLDLRMKESE